MRIGIDTLFEDPDHGSSAIDYLTGFVRTLGTLHDANTYFLFVSRRNRKLFQSEIDPRMRFINCGASNENRALRILAQQTQEPVAAGHHALDVLFSPGNAGPLCLRAASVVKINTLHHYLVPHLIGGLRSFYRRVMFSASARRADKILANSQATKQDICRLMGVPAEKIVVIYEAVSDEFRPEQNMAALARRIEQRLKVAPGYILFTSNLYRYKNVDTLIRAFARLLGLQHDARLLIAGGDPDGWQIDLECLVSELGIGQRVQFLGHLPNDVMPDLYRAAAVLVYPSLSETFGKPVVEAMRCGVPVIGARRGSIPEILGPAGILVEADDTEGFADAMLRILTDGELHKRFSRAGITRGQDFDWRTTTKKTIDLCVEAAAHRRAR